MTTDNDFPVITELLVGNFKSFKNLSSAKLAPITLIFGPNSSGKTSLIQALQLLKQTLLQNSPGNFTDLLTQGPYVDLGNFKTLIHGHKPMTPLHLGFKFTFGGLPLHGSLGVPLLRIGGAIDYKLSFKGKRGIGTRLMLGSELTGVTIHADIEVAITLPENHPDLETPPIQQSLDLNYTPSQIDSARKQNQATRYEQRPKTQFTLDDKSLKSLVIFCESIHKRSILLKNLPFSKIQDLDTSFSDHYYDEKLDAHLNPSQKEHYEKLTNQSSWDLFRNDWIEFYRKAEANPYLPNVFSENLGERLDFSDETRYLMRSAFSSEGEPYQIIEFLGSFVAVANWRFEDMRFIGPLRRPIQRVSSVSSSEDYTYVGSSGEHTPQMLAAIGPTADEYLSNWFKDNDIPYKIQTEITQEEVFGEQVLITLTDLRTGTTVSPADVGFGIGQLLPILMEGMYGDTRLGTICVEQPELHIHPRLQSAVTDFLIHTALKRRSASLRKRWIVETHSELIILRLLTRIREGQLSPDDVSVLYVNFNNKDGSQIKELRIDPEGNFEDEWPDGFFDEAYRETLA